MEVQITINGLRAPAAEKEFSPAIINFILGVVPEPTPAPPTPLPIEASSMPVASMMPTPGISYKHSSIVDISKGQAPAFEPVHPVHYPQLADMLPPYEPSSSDDEDDEDDEKDPLQVHRALSSPPVHEEPLNKEPINCALVLVDKRSTLANHAAQIISLTSVLCTSIVGAAIPLSGFGCWKGSKEPKFVGGIRRTSHQYNPKAFPSFMKKLSWTDSITPTSNVWRAILGALDQAKVVHKSKGGRFVTIIITDCSRLGAPCVMRDPHQELKTNPWISFHFIHVGPYGVDLDISKLGKVHRFTNDANIAEFASSMKALE